MYELIYMSSAANHLTKEDISEILLQARRFNFDNSVNGILLYIDGDFIQVLEGRKEVIENLFEKIKKDSRHNNVVILHEGIKSKREFPDWTMGFYSASYEILRSITGLKDLNKRDLSNIEDKNAFSF
ncbi:BLUF domain-containing protein [Flavobacterium luteum]|uniref:BLUF domain-containing protein n=1 Tax=Flavobacterium luteum TaxID=2026654 RepID=A0A7J5AH24_9FLAO|nr:BLUF domain-containing protein [Flavobacterium luteum]KAB1156793.1 BLUF domain-containing protein [Flavobacterium luteum]